MTLTRDVYVGEAEVTQALYRSVMGENPSFYSSCGPTCPVEQVSWYDAVRLANALSEQVGVAPCYTIDGDRVAWPEGPACVGYRLPTEAEWEVAARGGRSPTYAGSSRADGVAWTQANSRSKTHPVGEKRPNDLGLHDMSGNVAEWCWDAYGLYPAKSTDPVGPVDGEQRVVRGASWFHLEGEARVTNRDFLDPSSSGFAVGVRLVRSAPPVP